MDLIEFNKLTRESRALSARNNLYQKKEISQEDAAINCAYAIKKMYGIRNALKIFHALGIKDFKI